MTPCRLPLRRPFGPAWPREAPCDRRLSPASSGAGGAARVVRVRVRGSVARGMTESGCAVSGPAGSGAAGSAGVMAGGVVAGCAGRAVRAPGRSPPGARPGAAWRLGAVWPGAGGPASVRRATGPVSPACEPQSWPGRRGGPAPDSRSSSMTAQLWVTVASADASLTANAEYPGSASASPAAPARPSQAARTDARFHSENWPGGYTGPACLGAGGNPWMGPRSPLPVPPGGLTCAGAALWPPGTPLGTGEPPAARDSPARRGSGLTGAWVAPVAWECPGLSPGPVRGVR
jgi:hypothetical protein